LDSASRNFAWYANLFFMLGVLLLQFNKRSGVFAALMAAIISIDTIRFSVFVLNEAGTESPLYGYGWGAVAWFLSICLLLIAAGTRQTEKRIASGSKRMLGTSLRPLGAALGIIVFFVSCYWALSDRSYGNSEELERLSIVKGIAFKRGPVCHSEIEMIGKPVENFNGVLEIKVNADLDFTKQLFDEPDRLLDWGVRIVRLNSFRNSKAWEPTPVFVHIRSWIILQVHWQHRPAKMA
jgi:hypothetical protein